MYNNNLGWAHFLIGITVITSNGHRWPAGKINMTSSATTCYDIEWVQNGLGQFYLLCKGLSVKPGMVQSHA